MSQTKHTTGTELESKQLTIQMGQTEVRSTYAYLYSVGESFSREVVSESPEASRDRHLDRQRPLAKSFESRERPLATGIYVAGGLRRLV